MEVCKDLLYDRFLIEFFPIEAVSCGQNPCVRSKCIRAEDVIIDRDELYLQVGCFQRHSSKRIATNDSATKVHTKLEEKQADNGYKVTLEFQFDNLDSNSLSLCNAMFYVQFHVLVHHLAMDGSIAQSLFIYNGWQGAQAATTVRQGTATVEMEIGNLNGIQLMT